MVAAGEDAPLAEEAKAHSMPPPPASISAKQHLLHQGGQLRVEGDVVMAQAQLFGKTNELHLGFVLVGAACHLEELPWGGSVVSSMHGGPQPSLPAPWGQPPPKPV